ncbi:MAG: MerR family transcriptional regulator [Clostridiales bacterium]|nr:MerR family transcriptional regulator [Clostridiales bacterium]
MNNIVQCRLCKKPFQSTGGMLCRDCLLQLDEDFVKVRDYLEHNPGNAGINEIAEATGISKRNLIELLNEERLTRNTVSADLLLCSVCKQPILVGSICEKCKKDLASALNATLPKSPTPEQKRRAQAGGGPRMHVRSKLLDD